MTRRWFALTSSFVLVTTLVTAAVAQNAAEDSNSHSIFGYWFGKRDKSSQQSGGSSIGPNSGRQISNADNAPYPSPQTSNNNNQMPPDPAASSDSLPGLG